MKGVILVYDGQCPMCSMFSQRIRLKKTVGDLELVDARSDHYLLPELKRRNIDLNKGMVLLVADQIYTGQKAAQALAGMTSKRDSFNRMVYLIFRNQWLAMLVYPLLRLVRGLLLALLWRRSIK